MGRAKSDAFSSVLGRRRGATRAVRLGEAEHSLSILSEELRAKGLSLSILLSHPALIELPEGDLRRELVGTISLAMNADYEQAARFLLSEGLHGQARAVATDGAVHAITDTSRTFEPAAPASGMPSSGHILPHALVEAYVYKRAGFPRAVLDEDRPIIEALATLVERRQGRLDEFENRRIRHNTCRAMAHCLAAQRDESLPLFASWKKALIKEAMSGRLQEGILRQMDDALLPAGPEGAQRRRSLEGLRSCVRVELMRAEEADRDQAALGPSEPRRPVGAGA
jgi:hypothetical protein